MSAVRGILTMATAALGAVTALPARRLGELMDDFDEVWASDPFLLDEPDHASY